MAAPRDFLCRLTDYSSPSSHLQISSTNKPAATERQCRFLPTLCCISLHTNLCKAITLLICCPKCNILSIFVYFLNNFTIFHIFLDNAKFLCYNVDVTDKGVSNPCATRISPEGATSGDVLFAGLTVCRVRQATCR